MDSGKIGVKKIIIISTLVILFSAALAIAVHAILPVTLVGNTGMDISQFDSILVRLFGFPIVASSYFAILYTQSTIAIRFVCKENTLSNLQTGIRLGLSFALIYMIGMQEVVLESSPFKTYGIDFIKYQFITGIGDAIPVIILCLIVALLTVRKKSVVRPVQNLKWAEKLAAVAIIGVGIFLERTIAYELGIITSSCHSYTLPCYIWTVLFGVVLGFIYTLLYSALASDRNWIHTPVKLILTLGINWMIFNSFIGLIMKGAMPEMLLRSGLDVAVLFIASCIIGKFIIKR